MLNCVCLCLRGKVLNSRPIFDNFLTLKLNCFSVFSLIRGRKKDKFKDGAGSKKRVLYFFKKRIRQQIKKNNGKLNLLNLLMGVAVQEVLLFCCATALIVK